MGEPQNDNDKVFHLTLESNGEKTERFIIAQKGSLKEYRVKPLTLETRGYARGIES